MTENITREEMEKAKDAFHFGDIGSDTETGYKLLHKDEETINLIGKVLFNLANNKIDGKGKKRLEKLVNNMSNFSVNNHPDKVDVPKLDYYRAFQQAMREAHDVYEIDYNWNTAPLWNK